MSERPALQLMVGGKIPLDMEPVAELELTALLGSGAFGFMWQAVDTATGKPYALKVIDDVKPGSIQAERVRLEAEVAIHSDYVVPVIGLREWDPSTFLILFEYFPGRDLKELIRAKSLTAEQKNAIFHQTLIGVADAHRHNIIHRDLKPANILVDERSRVKVIDFGISKFKDKDLTQSGRLMGTLPYLPPELLIADESGGSKAADARTDIYALGHILYELAMGRHFWLRQGWKRGLEDFAVYLGRKPRPSEAIDLADFQCDFHPGAAATLARMVKIKPTERYAAITDVMAAMEYAYESPRLKPEDLHLRSPMLIVESGTNRGARTVLGLADGEARLLGRADIAGSDRSISRRHLEFSRSGDRYFVRDLGSKNGALLRGLALEPQGQPVEIEHTDRIKVGDIFLRFVFLPQKEG